MLTGVPSVTTTATAAAAAVAFAITSPSSRCLSRNAARLCGVRWRATEERRRADVDNDTSSWPRLAAPSRRNDVWFIFVDELARAAINSGRQRDGLLVREDRRCDAGMVGVSVERDPIGDRRRSMLVSRFCNGQWSLARMISDGHKCALRSGVFTQY